jgi:16S rRNA (guanine966-N2)-methyltransferase
VTRIIAGVAGGRRLGVPRSGATRPTSDRVREGLFSTLESLRGSLAGARFLDLYAGSGAVGLEAVSRGAATALLVESDARAAAVARDNVRAVGVAGVEVRAEKVERLPAAPPTASYDVVFADPPYATTRRALADLLGELKAGGWIATDAVVVVERATRDGEWVWPAGFEAVRARRYGDSTLWYGRSSA